MGDPKTPRQMPGIAVDAQGGAVVDPTANVLDLVEAAVRRQDDLRSAAEKLYDAEVRHLNHMAELRAEFSKELRELESKRVDANRQVDVLAAKTEAAGVLAAVQTLAATTASTAETLRNTLASTLSAVNERIASLEKSSYTGAGKGAGEDATKAAARATIAAIVAVLGLLGMLVFNLVKRQ